MTDIYDTNTTPEGSGEARRGNGKHKPPNDGAAANGYARGAAGNGKAGNGATSFAPGMDEEAVVAAIVRRIEATGDHINTLIGEALAAGAIDEEAAIRIPFVNRQAFDEARARAASNGAARMDPAERAYWMLLDLAKGDGIDPKKGDFLDVVRSLFDKAIDAGLTGDQIDNVASALRGKVSGQDNKRLFERVFARATERHAAKHLAAELERLKAQPIDYSDHDSAELLIAAKELASNDPRLEERIRAIMARAVELGTDGLDRERLTDAFMAAMGKRGNRRALKTEWNGLQAAWDKKEATREAEQREARKAEEAANRESRKAELHAKVSDLALHPQLIKEWCRYGQDQGLVRANRDFVAVRLTLDSRLLNESSAIALLRRGAAASGKNAPVTVALRTMPEGVVDQVSGASPKSIFYEGGEDDVDAYKHRVIYIPEAVVLSESGKLDNETASALRTLISEGRIVYKTVVVEKDSKIGKEMRRSKSIIKNGPIAVITTSARDNVDEELLTRLMISDADEGRTATTLIMDGIAARNSGDEVTRLSWTDAQIWVDFEEWLMLDGPYEVIIPFGKAILASYLQMPKLLRIRRDFDGLFKAIKTSAIIHRAQREVDDKGRIIAEIDDYRWACFAFARSMGGVYHAEIKETTIRLVEVLENELAAKVAALKPGAQTNANFAAGPAPGLKVDEWVQISRKKLRLALGIESNSTVDSRISDAVAADVIQVQSPSEIGGARQPKLFRILVASKDLAKLKHSAFPTIQMVRTIAANPVLVDRYYPQFLAMGLVPPRARDDYDEEDF